MPGSLGYRQNFRRGQCFGGLFLTNTQNGLGNDDGAIHDHAKVDGTERKQIGGHAKEMHEREDDGQRKWNGDGRDNGAARTSQKERQDHDNQQNTLNHGFRDLVGRGENQIVSVDIGNDADMLGGKLRLKLRNRLVQVFQNYGRVFTTQHGDDTLNGIGIMILP